MRLKSIIPITATALVLLIGSCTKDTTTGLVDPTLDTATDLQNDQSAVLKSSDASSDYTVYKLTSPKNNAIGVPLEQIITAEFNNNLTNSQIAKSSFTLKAKSASNNSKDDQKSNSYSGIAVDGTLSFSGSTLIFTPKNKLNPTTVYIATITSRYFSSSDDGRNKASYSWHFTTGTGGVVTTIPTVSLTDPINAATGVVFNKPIAITFSEAMDPLTINASTFTVKQGTVAVAGAITYSGKQATFTPSSNYAPNTVYTVTVTTGAKDVSGFALLSNYSFSFTTAAALDVTPPTVVSSDPTNSATAVAVSKVIAVSFSESLNPSTLNATSFTVKLGTTAVAGTVAYSGTTATFTPSASLTASSVYTGTITGVKDLAGNALAANYTFSFTTAAAADVTAPTVTLVDPINNATGVTINKVLSVTFSKAMNASTLSTTTFTLKQGTAVVAGTVAYAASVATFTPSANLVNGASYTAVITTGAKDLAGNALASNYTFIFTTVAAADVTAPTVTLVDPLNNATGVAINKVVAVTFSEAMSAASLSATTFTLKQGTTAVAGTVAYSALKATFTPSASLVNGASYTAVITTGAKDVAGNALASNYTFVFTTVAAADVTAPKVNSTDPLANATAVATNKVVGVTFSEAMTASTISASTFTLKQGTTAVAGTVAYSGTTATFTPSAVLIAGTVYSATITTGAKDLAGNALTANTAWSFTTAGTPPAAPLSFATDVMPVLSMCENCHTHGWTPSTVATTYYTNLSNSGYVNAASYTTSTIYVKLQSGHPGSGSISTVNTDKIINWMKQGSKNN